MKYVIATSIAVILSLVSTFIFHPPVLVAFFVGMVLGCGAVAIAAATTK